MLRFEQKELSPEAKRPGQTLRSPESHGLSTELKARLDSNQGMGTVLLNAAWHAQRARAGEQAFQSREGPADAPHLSGKCTAAFCV